MFYHGEGEEKECKKWITRGARLLDPYCMAQKAVHLFSVRASHARADACIEYSTAAMYYVTQAAQAGHILSMYRLAKMFTSGVLDLVGRIHFPARHGGYDSRLCFTIDHWQASMAS